MLKNKLSVAVLAGAMALLGGVGGTALLASAQTATTTNAPSAVTHSSSSVTGAADTPESANDPADTGTEARHHAPLGGDGVVSSITGSTIVIGEESNEGGASYTVDASKATVTNNGAAATLTDIKVGDKVFVQGSMNGTSVTATSVSLGHPGEHGNKAGDTDNIQSGSQNGPDADGGAASETSEPVGSSDTSEQ
ncbi:MAG: hypothetical protein KGH79_01845 [Patescibacteria group bacterium]|nr:hypothetical protein [Patescibacteria group bacterium]